MLSNFITSLSKAARLTVGGRARVSGKAAYVIFRHIYLFQKYVRIYYSSYILLPPCLFFNTSLLLWGHFFFSTLKSQIKFYHLLSFPWHLQFYSCLPVIHLLQLLAITIVLVLWKEHYILIHTKLSINVYLREEKERQGGLCVPDLA